MLKRFLVLIVSSVAIVSPSHALAQIQTWNNAGIPQGGPGQRSAPAPAAAPAPPRDLSGIWDAGGGGIAGTGSESAPLTPWGQQRGLLNKPGNGPRGVTEEFINDPLSIMCDPTGFPREVLYEYRPFQIVQTPNQVLMLYMFEKRWRVIWTDGRALPKDPEPRWYGYSVGKWEDDSTFVVQTVGMDERTWLDNAGNPHSDELKVEERYHRVNHDSMELTVTIDDPKTYTKPWTPRNKLPLKLGPPNMDMMEMICSATEAAAYKKLVDAQNKKK